MIASAPETPVVNIAVVGIINVRTGAGCQTGDGIAAIMSLHPEHTSAPCHLW
ncbi:hypothetical protein [Acetobacter cibinongensis]|uniref:hypothetical protein n=1 Tax=Acetobacter cibinongensis TaxID=146475 RepID=UPI0013FDAC0D|nr:hypothetical protein [Acetobacter cibinongensis]